MHRWSKLLLLYKQFSQFKLKLKYFGERILTPPAPTVDASIPEKRKREPKYYFNDSLHHLRRRWSQVICNWCTNSGLKTNIERTTDWQDQHTTKEAHLGSVSWVMRPGWRRPRMAMSGIRGSVTGGGRRPPVLGTRVTTAEQPWQTHDDASRLALK